MENQHRKIKGYKELDQNTIDQMNAVKQLGNAVGDFLDELEKLTPDEVDPRWLAIGKTDLQKGFMAVVRSIAKPDFF